jgi:asparaginyl-tRNA synthetase
MSHPWYGLILKLFDGFQYATTAFWRERGVCSAPLPITTGSVSSPMGLGSDSSPVGITLAGVDTYLADSQQFALEFLCRLAPSGCYYVMPSFRGEENDPRHLGQFMHSEAEIPGKLDDVIAVTEDYLVALARFYLEELSPEIEAAVGNIDHLERLAEGTHPFRRTTFEDAVAELRDCPGGVFEDPSGEWRTITAEGEQALMARLGEFTWVTHFDALAVPFYQAVGKGPSGREVAKNADLLFGIGETVGAGERHPSAPEVRRALKRHHVCEAEYSWYVRLREEQPLQTAGFGMGVERFLLWLLQHNDIRDLMLLARANGVNIVP